MRSAWRCEAHGEVLPLVRHLRVGPDVLRSAVAHSRVPIWAPLPMPPGWCVTGLEQVGDERSGGRAVVLALTGPSPLGGPADVLLLSEEPGVGLATRHAGLTDREPDLAALLATPPEAKVETAGHPTVLWRCDAPPDRVAYVGEAGGVWFWAVLWPASAAVLLDEHVALHDLRHGLHAGVDLPIGASSPRLV